MILNGMNYQLILCFGDTTFSITTLRIMTLSITKVNIMDLFETLSFVDLFVTFSINDTWHK
jgi:hypothetical protein